VRYVEVGKEKNEPEGGKKTMPKEKALQRSAKETPNHNQGNSYDAPGTQRKSAQHTTEDKRGRRCARGEREGGNLKEWEGWARKQKKRSALRGGGGEAGMRDVWAEGKPRRDTSL